MNPSLINQQIDETYIFSISNLDSPSLIKLFNNIEKSQISTYHKFIHITRVCHYVSQSHPQIPEKIINIVKNNLQYIIETISPEKANFYVLAFVYNLTALNHFQQPIKNFIDLFMEKVCTHKFQHAYFANFYHLIQILFENSYLQKDDLKFLINNLHIQNEIRNEYVYAYLYLLHYFDLIKNAGLKYMILKNCLRIILKFNLAWDEFPLEKILKSQAAYLPMKKVLDNIKRFSEEEKEKKKLVGEDGNFASVKNKVQNKEEVENTSSGSSSRNSLNINPQNEDENDKEDANDSIDELFKINQFMQIEQNEFMPKITSSTPESTEEAENEEDDRDKEKDKDKDKIVKSSLKRKAPTTNIRRKKVKLVDLVRENNRKFVKSADSEDTEDSDNSEIQPIIDYDKLNDDCIEEIVDEGREEEVENIEILEKCVEEGVETTEKISEKTSEKEFETDPKSILEVETRETNDLLDRLNRLFSFSDETSSIASTSTASASSSTSTLSPSTFPSSISSSSQNIQLQSTFEMLTANNNFIQTYIKALKLPFPLDPTNQVHLKAFLRLSPLQTSPEMAEFIFQLDEKYFIWLLPKLRITNNLEFFSKLISRLIDLNYYNEHVTKNFLFPFLKSLTDETTQINLKLAYLSYCQHLNIDLKLAEILEIISMEEIIKIIDLMNDSNMNMTYIFEKLQVLYGANTNLKIDRNKIFNCLLKYNKFKFVNRPNLNSIRASVISKMNKERRE